MQQILHGLSFPMLFLLAVLGFGVYISFGVYRRLILPMFLTKDSGPAHQRTLGRVEIIAWIGYALLVIYFALLNSLLVTVILLALLVFAFFDFWKNYFAGIILRFSDKIQVGDTITIQDYSGKILEFGNRSLKLISSGGEEVLIPYQRINAEVKIGQKSVPKVLFKTYVLEGAVHEHAKARQQLEKALYSNPWIIVSKPISIALEDKRASLSFYVLDNDFFEKAKLRLLRDLGG